MVYLDSSLLATSLLGILESGSAKLTNDILVELADDSAIFSFSVLRTESAHYFSTPLRVEGSPPVNRRFSVKRENLVALVRQEDTRYLSASWKDDQFYLNGIYLESHALPCELPRLEDLEKEGDLVISFTKRQSQKFQDLLRLAKAGEDLIIFPQPGVDKTVGIQFVGEGYTLACKLRVESVSPGEAIRFSSKGLDFSQGNNVYVLERFVLRGDSERTLIYADFGTSPV